MSTLVLDPYIPLALWVPLAAAAGVLLAWYGRASRKRLPGRRWGGVLVLMAIAVAVPLAILLNPTWLERIPPPAGKPLLTVLVDRSASMATRDVEGGASRYEAACRTAREAAERLADRYEVRVRTFAGDSISVAPEQLAAVAADGPITDLASAVEEALDPDRPQGQGVLLVSDGGHNAGGGADRVLESATKAKAMAAPVYVRTLGGQSEVRDLEVTLGAPQELAFVGQPTSVAVRLRQRGRLGQRTSLSLVYGDREIDRRDVELKPDGVTEATFTVSQPGAGLFRYEVRARALPGEVIELNNRATLLLRVVDQPVRVLLLEGKPYWDTKFLVRILSSDPSIELVSVVQMAEERLLQRTIGRAEKPSPPAPLPSNGRGETTTAPLTRGDQWTIRKDARSLLTEPGALESYQMVVLGRDAEVFLNDPALARLKKWLTESEGSLICFRGPPSSQISQRLAELMPVRWTPSSQETRFHVRWTSAGQALRWFPASTEADDVLPTLPSLAGVARPDKLSPLAEVLASSAAGKEGQGTPAISYQPVGAGRVVVIEGAGMWRWAFLPPQFQKHDDLYGTLWRNLIRWLVAHVGLLPHEQMALRTEKVTFTTTESASATFLMRATARTNQVPQVELTGDTIREPRRFSPAPFGEDPGQFRVAFGRLPEGRYLAQIAAAGTDKTSCTAAFDVRGNLAERLEVKAQPNLMKAIAEHSGGAVLDDAGPAVLAEQFDRYLDQSRPQRVAQTTAWDRAWVLLAAVTLWGAAWGLRRWSGLV